MKRIVVFLFFLLAGICGLMGQNCYESTRAQGVSAYNNGQYSKAKEYFEAALNDCPDKPIDHDLDEWIRKCLSAIEASARRQEAAEKERLDLEYRQKEDREQRQREEEERRQQEEQSRLSEAWRQSEERGYIEVTDIVFANLDSNWNVLDDYGETLYASDMRYLAPKIYYNGLVPEERRIDFFARLYDREGDLLMEFDDDYIFVKPGDNTAVMYPVGNRHESVFRPGRYRYEVWYGGRKLYTQYVSLYKRPDESTYLTVDGKSNLSVSFSGDGGSKTFAVFTDAEDWRLLGVPSFCSVENKTSNTFTLRCNGNIGNARKDFFWVETKNDDVRIDVSQEEAFGTLSVSANVPMVGISISSSSSTTQFIGHTPLRYDLPPGSYTVRAEKDGYKYVSPKSVRITRDQVSYAFFQLKKDRWISREENCAAHFFEPKYGYGFNFGDDLVSRHYVGFNYGYVRAHMGLHTSLMYGLGHSDIAFSIGPLLRLTEGWRFIDFQLYAAPVVRYDWNTGVADPIFKNERWHLMGEAGLRMNFDDANFGDFSWASLSLGCQFSKDAVIPTAGVSLFPVAFAMGMYEKEFSRHFLDVLGGYDFDNGEIFLGGSYSWVKTHLGFYTSFLVGFDGGWSASVAPLFRLTTDISALDLQVYAGPAMLDMEFAGDMGLRFAWRGGTALSLWDFAFGCQISGSRIVPTFSVGIGIPLVIGTCGAAFAFL